MAVSAGASTSGRGAALDVPCLQKPCAYHGHSLTFSSGFTWRYRHSALLHSPAVCVRVCVRVCQQQEAPRRTSQRARRTVAREEVAWRHLLEVVLVQELAVVALLAEAAQPGAKAA